MAEKTEDSKLFDVINEEWSDYDGGDIQRSLRHTLREHAGAIAELQGGALSTLSVSLEGGTVQSYVRGTTDVRIGFRVDCTLSGQPDLGWTARIYVIKGYSAGATERVSAGTVDGSRVGGDASTVHYTPDLSPLLSHVAGVEDRVLLEVENADGTRTTTRTVTLPCSYLELALAEGTSIGALAPATIGFIPRYAGTSPRIEIQLANVANSDDYTYYDQQFTLESGIASGGYVAFTLPQLTSGVYRLTAVLTLAAGSVRSEPVATEFIVPRADGYMVAVEPVMSAQQYDTVSIRFAVYAAGAPTARIEKVELEGGEELSVLPDTVATVTDAQSVGVWEYQVPRTHNTLAIRVLDPEGRLQAARAIQFDATPSDVAWQAPDGAELFLTALGKTNTGAAATWESGPYTTTFRGVPFATGASGWYEQKMLRLIGGATATVGITPFYAPSGSILDTGRTVKIRFKTSNIRDIHTPVIDCWDEAAQLGMRIYPDSVYARFGAELLSPVTESAALTTHNDRRFREDTPVEVGFTIQPWTDGGRETAHEVRMYVNGQFAGLKRIADFRTLSQLTPVPITLGSEAATLDVYNIRVYNRCLSSYEMLQAHTMDLDSNDAMLAKYDKNQCYTMTSATAVAVTFDKMLAYGKAQSLRGQECALYITSDNRYGEGNSTKTWNNRPQVAGFIFFRAGAVDTDRTVLYRGRPIRYNNKDVWEDNHSLRKRTQGTSTAEEVQKNGRDDAIDSTKKREGDPQYNPAAYQNGLLHDQRSPQYDPASPTQWYGGVYKYRWDSGTDDWRTDWDEVVHELDLHLMPYGEGGAPQDNACTLITTKQNFNESTSTRNLPMAKWTDDAKRLMQNQYADILTPPQRVDPKVRQTIYGIPAVQFLTEGATMERDRMLFNGKIDIITDKANMSVFGFGLTKNARGEDEDFSIETRDNGSLVCNFRSADLSDAAVLRQDGSPGGDHLEYRYPDQDSQAGVDHLAPGGALQRAWDFLASCDPNRVGWRYEDGRAVSTADASGQRVVTILGRRQDEEGNIYFDTPENRARKFAAEWHAYFVRPSLTFAALVVYVLQWIDQRAKNQFFTHFYGDEVEDWTGTVRPVLRLLEYDMDTSERADNRSRLRLDFQTLPEDGKGFYDDSVDETDDIYTAQKLEREKVGSLLYDLMDQTQAEEIGRMFGTLSAAAVPASVAGAAGATMLSPEGLLAYAREGEAEAWNDVIYNADAEWKYLENAEDDFKAHGSAIEDLDWWLRGRLYFMGGMFYRYTAGSTFYKDYMMSVNVGFMDATQGYDAWNVANFSPRIPLTARYRNYFHGGGNNVPDSHTPRCEAWTGSGAPDQSVTLDLGVSGQSIELSANLYGLRAARSIDLSRLYLVRITSWGNIRKGQYEDVGLEQIILGSTAPGYYNAQLASLNASASHQWKFGCCRLLNIAGCRAFQTLDLTDFPVLEELEASGCTALAVVTMPATQTLRRLSLPGAMTALVLDDKPRIERVSIEGTSALETLTARATSDAGALAVLNALAGIYT